MFDGTREHSPVGRCSSRRRPVGRGGGRRRQRCIRALPGDFYRIERIEQRISRGEIFLANGFQLGQMRGYGNKRYFQRSFKSLPQRPAGRGRQFVQFFPAVAQVFDGIGMLFDGDLLGGTGFGEHLGLQYQIVTHPSSTPMLPTLESRRFTLQGFDACLHAFFNGDTFRVVAGFVDGGEIFGGLTEMAACKCFLGLAHK